MLLNTDTDTSTATLIIDCEWTVAGAQSCVYTLTWAVFLHLDICRALLVWLGCDHEQSPALTGHSQEGAQLQEMLPTPQKTPVVHREWTSWDILRDFLEGSDGDGWQETMANKSARQQGCRARMKGEVSVCDGQTPYRTGPAPLGTTNSGIGFPYGKSCSPQWEKTGSRPGLCSCSTDRPPANVPASHQGQEAPGKLFIKMGMTGAWSPKPPNPLGNTNPKHPSPGNMVFSSDKESPY